MPRVDDKLSDVKRHRWWFLVSADELSDECKQCPASAWWWAYLSACGSVWLADTRTRRPQAAKRIRMLIWFLQIFSVAAISRAHKNRLACMSVSLTLKANSFIEFFFCYRHRHFFFSSVLKQTYIHVMKSKLLLHNVFDVFQKNICSLF